MPVCDCAVVELVASNDLLEIEEGVDEVICVNVTNTEQIRERNVTLSFTINAETPYTGTFFGSLPLVIS